MTTQNNTLGGSAMAQGQASPDILINKNLLEIYGRALGDYLEKDIAGSSTTPVDLAIEDARYGFVLWKGTRTQPLTINLPNPADADATKCATARRFTYRNTTGQTLTFQIKDAGGTSVTLATGAQKTFWHNGVDIFEVGGASPFAGLTQGSVPFVGASGAVSQDNAALFWDATNDRLGIGTNAPAYPLDVSGAARVGSILRIRDLTSTPASPTETIIETDADPSNTAITATFIYGTPRVYLGKSGSGIYALSLANCGQIEDPPPISWSGTGAMIQNGGLNILARQDDEIRINEGGFFQTLKFYTNGRENMRIDNAGVVMLWDGSLKAVTFGANDSGGSGFKVLRVAN